MSVKPDRWIRQMALEHKMIEPFTDRQIRAGVISYGVSSYGYDIRVADEFKIFTNVNSTIVDPKHFDARSLVEYKGDAFLIPEFLCAGALGGIFPDSAKRFDDLPGEIDVRAVRDHRECDAVRARMGRICDSGDQQYHAVAGEDLRE